MRATRHSVSQFIPGNLTTGDNLGLRLDKLNQDIDDDRGYKYKERSLDAMVSFFMGDALRSCYSHFFNEMKQAHESRPHVDCFDLQTISKAILGSGNASVHEFGFNLNKPWGVPYISGSSLKGLASAYLSSRGSQEWSKKCPDGGKSDLQIQLFGGSRQSDKTAYSGSVIFNDAWLYPMVGGWFVGDIINVHYQKYYSAVRLPDGTENPIPVKFAALKPGLKFYLCLEGPERERKFVKEILKRALIEEGIGGKTAVGYGRIELMRSRADELAEVMQELASADSAKVVAMYAQWKNAPEARPYFVEAINRLPLNKEFEPLYLKYAPLKYLLLYMDQAKTFGELQAIAKRIRNNIDNYTKLQEEANESIKRDPDAQKLFNLILEKYNPDTEQISQNRLLRLISYDWSDLDISEEKINGIVADLGHWKWPPLAELPQAMEQAGLSQDARELVEMELEDKGIR